MFRIGQKVVCVDNSPHGDYNPFEPDERPQVGEVYTVRRILPDESTGGDVLWLDEICRNEISIRQWNDPNLGYGAYRFKPVKETDISIFTAMLNPVTKKENA